MPRKRNPYNYIEEYCDVLLQQIHELAEEAEFNVYQEQIDKAGERIATLRCFATLARTTTQRLFRAAKRAATVTPKEKRTRTSKKKTDNQNT